MNTAPVVPTITPQPAVNSFSPGHSVPRYDSVNIFGNARIQLGDRYGANQDLFESGTEEERRDSLLNLLYYDGLDLKRAQIASHDVGPRSFCWVDSETGLKEWLELSADSEPFFWVNGKPGSGKSTIMKYLAESRSILNQLCASGDKWTVVYFFFDYRAGTSMANNPLGMLKLFLRQLSLIKEVKVKFSELPPDYLVTDDVDRYIDVLSMILRDLELRICAFIDGLDEYEGDLWDLCTLLETLQDRTGVKMCLASRPEAAFEQSFATYPTIVMQEHNLSSIRLYTRQKITKFLTQHPLVDEDVFSDDLLNVISEKAQGIILWARLVVDEMIKSCTTSTVQEDLFALVHSLPPELEALYERILNKTNGTYRRETATILHILMENDSSMKAMTLFQAFDYIKEVILQESKRPKSIDFQVAEARLKALLGNLVDFVRRPKSPVIVRLLHRSLSSYLARTKWVMTNLPNTLKLLFPDCFSKRLAIHCIQDAERRQAIPDFRNQETFTNISKNTQANEIRQAIELCKFGRIFTQAKDPTSERGTKLDSHSLAIGFRQRSCEADPPLAALRSQFHTFVIFLPLEVKWRDFYLHAIDEFFSFTTETNPALPWSSLSWPRCSVPLALIHFIRCARCNTYVRQWWHWYIILQVSRQDGVDLLINIIHDQDHWVLQELLHRYSCDNSCKPPSRPATAQNAKSQQPLENSGTVSCAIRLQLFSDLLMILNYRDADSGHINSDHELREYLENHSGIATPVCIFEWDLLSTGRPNIEDYLLRFLQLQKSIFSTHGPRWPRGKEIVIPRKYLDHHPACPLAKTHVDASHHLLLTKSVIGTDWASACNIDMSATFWALMKPSDLRLSFQDIRGELNLLFESEILSGCLEKIEQEAKTELSQTILPSQYRMCGSDAGTAFHYVDEVIIEALLEEIMKVISKHRSSNSYRSEIISTYATSLSTANITDGNKNPGRVNESNGTAKSRELCTIWLPYSSSMRRHVLQTMAKDNPLAYCERDHQHSLIHRLEMWTTKSTSP